MFSNSFVTNEEKTGNLINKFILNTYSKYITKRTVYKHETKINVKEIKNKRSVFHGQVRDRRLHSDLETGSGHLYAPQH